MRLDLSGTSTGLTRAGFGQCLQWPSLCGQQWLPLCWSGCTGNGGQAHSELSFLQFQWGWEIVHCPFHVISSRKAFEEHLGASQVAQWVKHLMSKHEALSSDPQQPPKNPGITAHACHLSLGEAESGGSQGLIYQPDQPTGELLLQQKLCLKN